MHGALGSTRRSGQRHAAWASVMALGLALISLMLVMPQPALAQPAAGGPDVIQLVGPVSLDQDLRTLPVAAGGRVGYVHPKLMRFPQEQPVAAPDGPPTLSPALAPLAPSVMPTPTLNFDGINFGTSGCSCLPPDTDGDVGPSHYIQSVNSSIKIFDKTGATLSGPTTFNSFFTLLGTGTPCGNNMNVGDGVTFYDHVSDRWVVTDFAFDRTSTAGPYYECIGVSKGSNPVSSGWWLFALQVDPGNVKWLGDYPKFGVWTDGYYLSVNAFDLSLPAASQFQGVRVYALNRSTLTAGTGTSAIAFTVLPATLGAAYSLLPATFRFGNPPAGQAEYFAAIDSSNATLNQVHVWRFHADFVVPASSTFGTVVSHAANGNITVANFTDAMSGGSTIIIPQTGTVQKLDSLGDKLMANLYYQRLKSGAESLYAVHTVNNSGPTGIRWYQFDVTGGVIPAGAAQTQTFTNGADTLYRWMPSLALDGSGDLAIGYSVSSSSIDPAIRYAGRLVADAANTLAQGEAVMQAGGGNQTHSSGRWGDYSAMSPDPSNSCAFWYTQEYYSASSSFTWNTRIGKFAFPTNGACGSPTAVTLSMFRATAYGAPTGVALSADGLALPIAIVGIALLGALALVGLWRR